MEGRARSADGAHGARVQGVLLDQFGVLHDGNVAFPEAIEAVKQLAASKKVYILSNSSRRAATALQKISGLGYPAECFAGALLSSGTPTVAIHAPSATVTHMICTVFTTACSPWCRQRLHNSDAWRRGHHKWRSHTPVSDEAANAVLGPAGCQMPAFHVGQPWRCGHLLPRPGSGVSPGRVRVHSGSWDRGVGNCGGGRAAEVNRGTAGADGGVCSTWRKTDGRSESRLCHSVRVRYLQPLLSPGGL